jgi:hypothetical protein
VTYPSLFNLFLKTHFVPIMFLFSSLGTSSHVLLFYIWSSSSSIALIQFSFLLASSKLLNSIVDNIARCFCSGEHILLLVSTPIYLFPMICYDEWFFCTHLLGVFGGTWRSYCYFSTYGCSSSSSDSLSTSSSFKSSSWPRSIESLLLSFIFNLFV